MLIEIDNKLYARFLSLGYEMSFEDLVESAIDSELSYAEGLDDLALELGEC